MFVRGCFMLRSVFIICNILTITFLCYGQSSFTETAISWGIEHRAHGIMGGGVAIFDYNNDGFQDIYLTGGHLRDELFRNNGNKTFTKITRYAGLHLTSYYNTTAVVNGDINNDGFSDIFVSTDSGEKCLLFLNKKDGTFLEIGSSAGITGTQWAMAATFGDFNLDGFLDIYITNYIQSHKSIVDENGEVIGFDHSCYPDKLFINSGDLTFRESSDINDSNGCGLAVASTDINNDNSPDIYVANDFGEWVKPNMAYLNKYPEPGFINAGDSFNIDAGIYGMGIAVGDYNRDGLLDYYVTNLGSNILYKNLAIGTFHNDAESAGVLNTYNGEKLATSWGTAFFDYNLDGFEDLFIANGYIPTAEFIGNSKLDPNKLYRNLGNGTFEDVSMLEDVADTKIGRGMATGDLDNDGDIDFVVATIGMDDDAGNVLVYENTTDNENSWLKVTVEGTEANRDGYGAKIKLYADHIVWVQEIDGGSSHGSHHSKIAHFGLGDVLTLDSMVIIWPGGKKQKFLNIESGQHLMIQEDSHQLFIVGCTDIAAENYNTDADYDRGCFIAVEGCMEENSPYFDPEANVQTIACGEMITASNELNEEGIVISQDQTYLYITASQYSNFQLIDLTGKIVYTANLSDNYMLNKSQLPSGIYIMLFYSGKAQRIKKIMIH